MDYEKANRSKRAAVGIVKNGFVLFFENIF